MFKLLVVAILSLLSAGAALAQGPASDKARPNSIILFVPDGLRASKVSKDLTPAMAAVRDDGVNFKNSHSLMPTFTTANASAMATGHYLGDTSDFSNTLYVGFSDETYRELPRTLAHDHAQNAHRISAERHSNAELLSPLID